MIKLTTYCLLIGLLLPSVSAAANPLERVPYDKYQHMAGGALVYTSTRAVGQAMFDLDHKQSMLLGLVSAVVAGLYVEHTQVGTDRHVSTEDALYTGFGGVVMSTASVTWEF